MSGPYRFTQESTRSPLDRQAPSFPASQPVSFKTNVNRMKTKKWVEAKKNAYDGDDWGEYDEYDEYGAEQATPPQPNPSQGPHGYGQRVEQPSRSFTDPQRQGTLQPGRRNSFEAGDEHRAFSASMAHPAQEDPHQAYGAPGQPAGFMYPAQRQVSIAHSDTSETPQHRRDFSPSAMPPPLQTRMSPAPRSTTDSPATQFPPRKSSIGQVDSPSTVSSRDRAPSNPSKALPFIRPADIYKRVEEERQRERSSMDSSRPSLDSPSHPRDEVGSPQRLQERGSSDSLIRSAETGRSLHPLETVAERKSEYLPDLDLGKSEQDRGKSPTRPEAPLSIPRPSLPPVEGISAFDSDFWSSSSRPQPLSNTYTSVVSPPDDQGFRSVVDQAFNRKDDQRSVPPTPISKSDSMVSRSNTASTSGISPIMSRVPSSATSALKTRNLVGGDGSTPMIAEEASESSTPKSQPTSAALLAGAHQIPRKPSPSASRNVSSSSLPRSGLATPSPGESPARSPVIAPQTSATEPESAQLATLSPVSPDAMTGGSNGPSPTYADREADIASAMKLNPNKATSELGAAEKDLQNAFLESHNAQSSIADAISTSRSESPSKGRVHELAGKFGEISQSRRGSTQSNVSRNSVQSWERSQDNSGPPSPQKLVGSAKEATITRPAAGDEESFRPKLPGQWESFATTTATPSEQENDHGNDGPFTQPLGELDLTPTTTKHPVSAAEPSKAISDPLAALKAAGTAVGDAIQASVGLGPSQQNDRKGGNDKEDARGGLKMETQDKHHGDVLPRPLQLDRTISAASSIPPTPPAKDTPDSEEVPPPPPLKEKSAEPDSPSFSRLPAERPTIVPQLSTDPSADDQESDRLRKEIVASLSPLKAPTTQVADPNRASLQPGPPPVNRESSVFPSEYETYWADPDRASPRPSHDLGSNAVEPVTCSTEQPPVEATSNPQRSLDFNKPSLLTRFSWEDHGSQPSTLKGQAEAGPAAQSKTGAQDEKLPSPAGEEVAKDDDGLSFQGIPDPYFGPAHSAATDKQELIREADLAVRAPTPPLDSAKPLRSPTHSNPATEIATASGLHVVNTELNPEAVDIPPRLSRETSPVSQSARFTAEEPVAAQKSKSSEGVPATESIPEPRPAAAPDQEPVSKRLIPERPLDVREIMTIKASLDRIAAYNRSRECWAHDDHGLSDWVASVVTAKPDLVTQAYPSQPTPSASATFRHRPTGSLSLFGKSNHQPQQSVSQTQSTPVASQPVQSSSPGGPGRSASHHMQSRGKDLLHSAGVLGGKGMTGAKGFFAKGKNRFKSDKASLSESAPSSREASEEPDFIRTPEKTTRISTDTDSPKEERKRRRFSNPFHRSSRSRSRPNSIALSASGHLDFSTIKQSTAHETSPNQGSRPHSYHAPDVWSAIPDLRSPPAPPDKSPNALERLGVLPSPAKSLFSLLPQEKEEEVPPVPSIPDSMGRTQSVSSNQEMASHRLLQSVIRHATPPAVETSKPRTPLAVHEPAPNEYSNDYLEGGHTSNGVQSTMASNDLGRISDLDEKPTTTTVEKVQQIYDAGEGDEPDEDDDQPPQLNNDPIPAKVVVVPLGQISDVSPQTAANGLEPGEISPVVSAVGADRLDAREREDDMHLQPKQNHLQKPRLCMGDVSPMFPPTTLALGIPADGSQRARGSGTPELRDGRPAYETELIGGDVSPISSRANDEDNDATPTQDAPARSSVKRMRQTSSAAVEVAKGSGRVSEKPAMGEALTPHETNTAPPLVRTEQRLSTSPYQVVHAVEYVPSHSSLETWEQDSVVAPSQSDGSQLGDKHDDAEVPPVPQLPSPIKREEMTKTMEPEHKPVIISISKSSVQARPAEPGSTQLEQQQHPSRPDAGKPGIHKRSESLLSKISSMVSADGASISPTSSHAARSRPSSANRQHQVSPAKASLLPAQIEEDPSVAEQKHMHVHGADDFDLYADHNGIVKGIHDERGKPLRVASIQPPGTANGDDCSSEARKDQDTPKAAEEDSTRYSDERPMSFVSGPRDAHGRPQDQINRPGTAEENPPPVPHTPERFLRMSDKAPSTRRPIAQDMPQQNGIEPQRSLQAEHPASQGVSPVASQTHNPQMPPHTAMHLPVANGASPPQPNPPQDLSQRTLLRDQRQLNGAPSDPRLQDPRVMQDPRLMVEARMRGTSLGQPYIQDPQMQSQMYSDDSRRQGQPMVPPTAPRNQFELQQQMMQRRGVDPRLFPVQYSTPGAAHSRVDAHLSNKEEKHSSRPKLSSVFKGLGSKSHSSNGQAMSTTNSIPSPTINGTPISDDRSKSYQPALGDLPEQVLVKKERKSSAFNSHSGRPESIGTESHVSQDSTRAQAADSRLDLRYPQSPAPFKGILPQQPPQGAMMFPQQQPHPQRMSNSGVPEPGKKKRFSALGNLFSRGGAAGHSGDSKPKLSKEDKKAQKAQKHTTTPPFQPPSGREWPPQPRPRVQPMQHDMQNGPITSARPFPGMYTVAPPPGPRQTISAVPPQHSGSYGNPQQYLQPPQGFQQYLQMQRAQARPEGSAYMETWQIAQGRNTEQSSQQFASQSVPAPLHSSLPSSSAPRTSFVSHSQVAEGTVQAPPPTGGYYKPDSKQVQHASPSAFAPTSAYQLQPQHHITQHPLNGRSVSSPVPAQNYGAVSPASQRQVSSPVNEPRYETPQIPAAYRQVSGAYIPPGMSDQHPPLQGSRPQSHYSRQYSEPQMQLISPQVSAPTQMPPSHRNDSNSSTVSVVSPISNPSPGMPGNTPVSGQRPQKIRMSSISETTQQENPWHLDLPQGATEQDIVRARQRQYMEQQLAAQEQMHAEKTGRSPSPRSSRHTQSVSPQPSHDQPQNGQQPTHTGGGFREVLPKSSPRPYAVAQSHPQSTPSQEHSPHPIQPAPVHPYQHPSPASYPLPMSPDSASVKSPVNPIAEALAPPPPPKIPHTPIHSSFPVTHTPSAQPHEQIHDEAQQYQSPRPPPQADFEQQPPTDEPPPYSGPGVPNDEMEKERPRPPNIVTDVEDRGRVPESRQRQASLGILQHPQPASMAASPQRSSADMGAEALRRQLLEQEERERQERLQRAEIQRAESERERQERERARARARELERSVSGGGRVGSLRSVQGSGRGNASGWERRGSTARPVFELPAEEDDEPVMRATSFPGQEWVPTWTED